MSTEQILLAILGAGGAIWAVFKVLIPRLVDAKLEADKYDRARSAFREDATFDLLKEALEYLEAALAESNKRATEYQKQGAETSKNIDRLAASINRQSDLIRILTQEISVLSGRREKDSPN